jgi:hypothetical protein
MDPLASGTGEIRNSVDRPVAETRPSVFSGARPRLSLRDR